MDNRGQGVVEYVLILTLFCIVAVAAWKGINPAMSGMYSSVSGQRAGIMGMRP